MEFIDLKRQYAELADKINPAITNVMKNASFIMGEEVELFEKELCGFLGVKHAIACASGTDALQLIYMAYDIKPGDAVFCPDVTFIASVEPAVMLGGVPVFCDIDRDTYTICPVSLEKQIKEVIKEGKYRPRFVTTVDFLGNPAHIDEIRSICNKYNLIMIEDGAQSFGAYYKGRPCCGFGDIAATSFFPAKPLGCYGDGGAVFTNDDEIATLCKSLRVHGKGSSKYDNVRIGLNSRLDTIQAAVLRVKLKALVDYEISNRESIALKYDETLKNHYKTPFVQKECKSIYAQYALLADSEKKRDDARKALDAAGIPNMIYYPTPQHMLKVFKGAPLYGETFNNSIEYCKKTFSVPMHAYLDEVAQNEIIEVLLNCK